MARHNCYEHVGWILPDIFARGIMAELVMYWAHPSATRFQCGCGGHGPALCRHPHQLIAQCRSLCFKSGKPAELHAGTARTFKAVNTPQLEAALNQWRQDFREKWPSFPILQDMDCGTILRCLLHVPQSPYGIELQLPTAVTYSFINFSPFPL